MSKPYQARRAIARRASIFARTSDAELLAALADMEGRDRTRDANLRRAYSWTCDELERRHGAPLTDYLNGVYGDEANDDDPRTYGEHIAAFLAGEQATT